MFYASQRRCLYVVVGPDPSRPNGVTTTGGRPPRPHLTHLTSNPFPHLISPFHFSFIVFPIVCSTEMDIWLHFNIYCPLLHLLIPVTHFTSVKCLKMSEQNWSVSNWSTHFLISPSTPPHLTRGPGVSPPPLINSKKQQHNMFYEHFHSFTEKVAKLLVSFCTYDEQECCRSWQELVIEAVSLIINAGTSFWTIFNSRQDFIVADISGSFLVITIEE